MAGIARGDVEILIRAGATSRAQDDARHRALVEAYLEFKPTTRQRLNVGIPNRLAEQIDRQADNQLQEELARSTQDERESTKSYRPDDEDTDYGTSGSRVELLSQDLDLVEPPQMIHSPVLSFNSVFNNADSPLFRGPTIRDEGSQPPTERRISQTSSASWEPSRSVISDSQPELEGQAPDFVSPTKRLAGYLDSFNTKGRYKKTDEGEQPQGRNGELLTGRLLNQPSASLPKGVQSSSPADLPSSPSPHKTPPRESRRILRSLQNPPSSQDPVIGSKRKLVDMVEDTPISSSVPKIARSTSFPLSLPSAKAQNADHAERPSSQPDPRSTVSSSKATDVATSSAGGVISPWADKLYIRAPPPAASHAQLTPEILITRSLQNIIKKMSQDIPFNPMLKTRELRGFERGHWLVDCKTWNDGLRARGWDMLGNFVGRNLAGWGVSCERTEDHTSLRVNCWGVMVEHVYYLLYLASEGKIKLGDADWIGGDGVAIIKMP